MWKRRKLKKKIAELELDLTRVNAILVANKKMMVTTYGEFNISRLFLEKEASEREKVEIESKIENLKKELSSI